MALLFQCHFMDEFMDVRFKAPFGQLKLGNFEAERGATFLEHFLFIMDFVVSK